MNDEQPPSGEPADPLMRAVAQYWDEIIQAADEGQRERLRGIVAGTVESDPVEARVALEDELMDLLPPDHPVIQIMRTRTMYGSAAADSAGARLAGALRWLRVQVLPPASGEAGQVGGDEPEDSGPAAGEWDAPDDPTLDEFDRQVQARLLDLASLTADEVRRNNVNPDDDGLIRLPGPDRAVRLPAFQFNTVGKPWPVVQEVNQRLDAVADPWGVTCWWVDPHQWLAASPADLLGKGRDDQLRWAAASIGEEWLCLMTSRQRA